MIGDKGGVPMTLQTVTLNVPDVLYARLKQRAQQANRTVEAELLEVLATAVPVADELPADLEAALSPLALLDDESLWRAAQNQLAPEAAAELENLHLKRQREGLTAAETQTLAGLVRQYERAMLVRAQAAALLKQRGHDVSSLVAPG
jgi:plasmid stability protein